MGNSTSSSGRGHHDDTVDLGALSPQGVYTGTRDWNQAIVSQLIVARKIAPFYRPLEEYDESWDDDQILAARKDIPDPENGDVVTRIESTHSSASKLPPNRRPGLPREPSKPEATVYRGAVECPICFLYYPPNINHSRCCDQAICTECFVQIKRAEPTTTHLVSEPAACPYCVQDNFGVVYTPPPWRSGIGSEGSASIWDSPRGSQHSIETSVPYPTHKRRQKSFGADSPEVVTTDQIRPDWEAKLAAVRAAVTRRANRRIIMRQVGDRLIPVGVTSGRVHALSPEEANAEGVDTGSRRSRRRQQQSQQNFEQFMGMGGQDLEELMLMEAMRLSLLDHEEHQRKEEEEQKKKQASSTGEGDIAPDDHTAAAGSSILESGSVAPSSTSSSPPSLNPNDSLAPKRKSWSFSRSRTPPPGSDKSSNQLSTSTPPPFSTLNAALASASTAAAFLRTSADNISSSASHSHADSQPEAAASRRSIPTITVGPSDINAFHTLDAASQASFSDNLERPELIQVDSTSSSMFLPGASDSGTSSYGTLPSSPDSPIHEPLLGLRSTSDDSSLHNKPMPTTRQLSQGNSSEASVT